MTIDRRAVSDRTVAFEGPPASPPSVASYSRSRGFASVLAALAGALVPQRSFAQVDDITCTVPWDEALASAQLTRASAQLAQDRPRDMGSGTLKTFDRLWDDWSLMPTETTAWARQLVGKPSSSTAAMHLAAKLLVATSEPATSQPSAAASGPASQASAANVTPATAAGPPGASTQAAPDRLPDVIAQLLTLAGAPLDEDGRRRLEEAAAAVPASVANEAASLLVACESAIAVRDQALRACSGEGGLKATFDRMVRLADQTNLDDAILADLTGVDLPLLCQGGQALLAEVDRVAAAPLAEAQIPFEFTWPTPWGKIVLAGTRDDTYDSGPYLMILDVGGDDHYSAGGGTADADHPVSVLIDFAGNDRYQSAGDFCFGAGVLGYGVTCDVAGNDSYQVRAFGIGTGIAGVGAVIDLAGNDEYSSIQLSQGAAVCGFGLLMDSAGTDRYSCFHKSQGYGGPRGCGILIDACGDDTYVANDEKLDFPSVQTAEHNQSLSQGFGFGRRGHYPGGDGRSVAGGIGLLIDGAGNDHYSAGLFAQGSAYWYALGALVDLSGNDQYEGVWYVQGSAAHYAAAALIDLSGDDKYRSTISQSLGHGHDFSVGVLADAAGDDLYDSNGQPVAWGNANGIGVLLNCMGNDQYRTGLLGYAADSRPEQLSLGLFVDMGGANVFPQSDPLCRPRSTWCRRNPDRTHEFGCGLSR